MFGLGWLEVVVILGVIFAIFGVKKLPEFGKSLGKTIVGFKKEISNSDDDDNDYS